jgi:prepilin-type N-terminal cleavage/methylation domain-containing protein
MNSKKIKGFTLIELLVVVSVISLLASIILAALGSARAKSKDTLLKEEALQMRNLLEQEYNDRGSYLGLNPNNLWMGSSTDCANATFTGNYVTQARILCNVIVANAAPVVTGQKFYLGTSSNAPNQYSIMIGLPYKNTYLCVGSSGSVTETDTGTANTAGCWNNP